MQPRLVPDIPPRAVIYLRQSVHKDDSISIEMQEFAGRDYCARMGYTVVAVEADEGLSGRRWDNRPAVKRAIDLIEGRNADVIILWKWSRLSRSRRDWALASDRVDVAGGRIESATEPIDTGTASGRFARGVMTEYAAFQSEQIGEQWEEVRQRRIRNGLPVSGRLPWGWEKHDGQLRPVPEQAAYVVEMYAKFLGGQGSASIARWMNAQGVPSPEGKIWSRERPGTLLDSPIHAGLIPYRGETFEGAHEGIIDRATWAEYVATRAARREGKQKPRVSHYLLSSLARCHCGYQMSGKSDRTRGVFYGGYVCQSMAPDHGPNYISIRKLDPLVPQWLAGIAKELDAAVDVVALVEMTTDLDQLRREHTALQKQLTNLTLQLAADIVPEVAYSEARAQIEARQSEITAAIDRHSRQQSIASRVSNDFIRGLVRDWEFMPFDGRRDAIRAVLERVTVTPGPEATAVFTSRWGTSVVLRV